MSIWLCIVLVEEHVMRPVALGQKLSTGVTLEKCVPSGLKQEDDQFFIEKPAMQEPITLCHCNVNGILCFLLRT